MAQLVEIKKVTVGPRDLDALVEIAPDAPLMTNEDIEATARVFHLMPELANHVCLGDSGRLFRDCMGRTELAHLLEHMTVELLARTNVAGDITCGRTYPVAGNERAFDVVFPCPDDVLVTSALSSAAWVLQWAFTGGGEPKPDVDAIVDGIVGLVRSVSGPVDDGVEQSGAAQEEAPEPADEATVAEEETPLDEEATPVEEPAADSSPESTLVSPALEPNDSTAEVDDLEEPDDVAEEAAPEPEAVDSVAQDGGDWDMADMPRSRPVR